jgi:hypothetical protein
MTGFAMSSQLSRLAASFLLSLLVRQPCIADDSKGLKNPNLNSAAMMLVHSWYDESCCHDKDCHPVPCAQIEKIGQGWQWRDGNQRHWFPPDRLKLSQDGHCHVCVSPRTIPSGICIYLPEET